MSEDYLIDLPEGEMIWFNSEYEVKELFSLLSHWFDLGDTWETYGFTIEGLKDEDDSVDEILEDNDQEIVEYGEYAVYPVFSDFYCVDQINSVKINTEDIILHPDIYYNFPMVGFVYFEKTFDRTGKVTVDVFHVSSVSNIQTIDTIKQKVEDNREQWWEEHEYRAELEEWQQRRMEEQKRQEVNNNV